MKGSGIPFIPSGGVNNMRDPTELTPGELVTGVNVDIRAAKSFRRRVGFSQDTAGVFHSFFGGDGYGLVVSDYNLYKFEPGVGTTLLRTLQSNAPMAYEKVNNTTVFSNGVDFGFVENGAYVAPVSPSDTFDQLPFAGEHLSFHNGRLLVGSGALLGFTKPWDLEAMDRRYNLIPFPADLKLVAALRTGCWVSSGTTTKFLAGSDPSEYDVRHKGLNVAVVPGTAVKIDAADFLREAEGDAYIFATSEGICIGLESGQLVNVSEQRVSLQAAERGAGFIQRRDGYLHYVVCLQQPGAYDNAYTEKTIAVDSQTIP